jgi:hypothetical protein
MLKIEDNERIEDIQSFLDNEFNVEIYKFFETAERKPWQGVFSTLDFFNFFYHQLGVVIKNKNKPIELIEYFKNLDATDIIKYYFFKKLEKYIHFIGKEPEKSEDVGHLKIIWKTGLEDYHKELKKKLFKIEILNLPAPNVTLSPFNRMWARVKNDISLLKEPKEKIEFLQGIKETELIKSLDSHNDELEFLSNERANYIKKLDSIIENLTRMLPPNSVGKSKEPIITDLRYLFKEEDKFEPFMNFLIAQNIVDKSYSWKNRVKSDAYQSKCACLIKSLKTKGYLKREPSGKEVIAIAENNFQVMIKLDTVKKTNPKKYRGFLNEIPHSKHLPIPPNPDHSTN